MITEQGQIDGFRNPMWRVRALKPGEAVALQQALVALEQRLAPAPTIRAAWHIGKLLSHWDSNQSAAAKDQMLEDWLDDLASYSEAHIAQACREWRRTETFKPKIAEMIALLNMIRGKDQESIRRARVLLGLEPPRHWEKIQPVEEVRTTRDVSGLLEKLGNKKAGRSEKRSAASHSTARKETDAAELRATLKRKVRT